MENVHVKDEMNYEEEEIIDLENINDTDDSKKQYRYRRLYDEVRQKSCFDKKLGFLKKYYFLLLCIMQATLILLFVISYFRVFFYTYKIKNYTHYTFRFKILRGKWKI